MKKIFQIIVFLVLVGWMVLVWLGEKGEVLSPLSLNRQKHNTNYFSQNLLADLFHYFEDSSYTPEWIWNYKDKGDYVSPWNKL